MKIQIQDDEWLYNEAKQAIDDFAWRFTEEGSKKGTANIVLHLNRKQVLARMDATLFDLLNKFRLYLDARINVNDDPETVIKRFETIVHILTDATIKASDPDRVRINRPAKPIKLSQKSWKNPVYNQIAGERR